MKILIATNHSYMLYRFRRELIAELQAEGHQVALSMPFVGHEDDFKAMGISCIETPIERRGVDPKKDAALFFTYRKLLKQERPDLVITYSIKPNVYCGLACALAGIPYSANVQGLGTAFQRRGLAQFVTILYRVGLCRAQTVFFENSANAEEFERRHIIPKKKICILPGAGINLQRYADTPLPPDSPRHFLYLGRIMREKGMDEWFAAAKRLKAEYGERAVFDMVGFYDDPEYEVQVQQLAEAGVVVFHGFQENPIPFYRAAHCVVLPSYHEGLSNVLLEAEAMGRPVVTSDIPGCREAVEDGVTGYLCRVKDADSLYEKMKQIMELPEENLREMGTAARAYMEANFAKEKVVRRTIEGLHLPL